MEKQTKILLGIGLASIGVVSYLILKPKKGVTQKDKIVDYPNIDPKENAPMPNPYKKIEFFPNSEIQNQTLTTVEEDKKKKEVEQILKSDGILSFGVQLQKPSPHGFRFY